MSNLAKKLVCDLHEQESTPSVRRFRVVDQELETELTIVVAHRDDYLEIEVSGTYHGKSIEGSLEFQHDGQHATELEWTDVPSNITDAEAEELKGLVISRDPELQ